MTCSHDSLSSDTAPDTPPTHASVESMTGHPPGRVTVASACRSPWQARSAAAPGGRRSIRRGHIGQPGRGACRDQRPTHAATSRSWRDSVGPLMLCGASPTGSKTVGCRRGAGLCRAGGPGAAVCRIQPRTSPRTSGPEVNPFEPARDRGVYVSGQAVAHLTLDPPAQTGCGTPSQRAGDPRSASRSPCDTTHPTGGKIGFLRSSNTAAPWAPPAPGEDPRVGNGHDPPGGPPFASGRSCDGRSRMSRSPVPPWSGRHRRGHAAHRARGSSHPPWPPPCSRSGRTGYACGPPTTPPATSGRLPATAAGSESRDKDERGTLRRYRSRYWTVRSATASPPGPGTRLTARSGRPVLAAVGWKSRVGVGFAS